MKLLGLILLSAFVLTACGKKKDKPERAHALDNLTPYVPQGWNTSQDWPQSALKWKDIHP